MWKAVCAMLWSLHPESVETSLKDCRLGTDMASFLHAS